MKRKVKKLFPRIRYCERCEELFSPSSKYSKICDRCNMNNNRITNKHIISLTGIQIKKDMTNITIKPKHKIRKL
jgi:Zn finger protein HypA/HybF involved in hydrogenase expression